MPNLTLSTEDLDAVFSGTVAIFGAPGSGKTTVAKSRVEVMLARGDRFVILDPSGEWDGLRLKADGVSEAFDIPVVGGLHPTHTIDHREGQNYAQKLAAVIAHCTTSCVIDISDLRDHEQFYFVESFLSVLVTSRKRLTKQAGGPIPGGNVRLVFDRADRLLSPLMVSATRLLYSALRQIMTSGDQLGIIPWYLTERIDLLTEVVRFRLPMEKVVALNTPLASDRHQFLSLILPRNTSVDNRRLMGFMLEHFPRGVGYVWSASNRQILHHQFARNVTFDKAKPIPDDPAATVASADPPITASAPLPVAAADLPNALGRVRVDGARQALMACRQAWEVTRSEVLSSLDDFTAKLSWLESCLLAPDDQLAMHDVHDPAARNESEGSCESEGKEATLYGEEMKHLFDSLDDLVNPPPPNNQLERPMNATLAAVSDMRQMAVRIGGEDGGSESFEGFDPLKEALALQEAPALRAASTAADEAPRAEASSSVIGQKAAPSVDTVTATGPTDPSIVSAKPITAIDNDTLLHQRQRMLSGDAVGHVWPQLGLLLEVIDRKPQPDIAVLGVHSGFHQDDPAFLYLLSVLKVEGLIEWTKNAVEDSWFQLTDKGHAQRRLSYSGGGRPFSIQRLSIEWRRRLREMPGGGAAAEYLLKNIVKSHPTYFRVDDRTKLRLSEGLLYLRRAGLITGNCKLRLSNAFRDIEVAGSTSVSE